MARGPQIPIVQEDTRMRDVIYEMSSKGLGMTCVVKNGCLIGIITDGDLRRHMSNSTSIHEQIAGQVMTRNPVTLAKSTLAAQAINVMEQRKITSIVVVDDNRAVEGVVHLHDLWRTGLI
jgi:arabinose-5-phosphate isomerase